MVRSFTGIFCSLKKIKAENRKLNLCWTSKWRGGGGGLFHNMAFTSPATPSTQQHCRGINLWRPAACVTFVSHPASKQAETRVGGCSQGPEPEVGHQRTPHITPRMNHDYLVCDRQKSATLTEKRQKSTAGIMTSLYLMVSHSNTWVTVKRTACQLSSSFHYWRDKKDETPSLGRIIRAQTRSCWCLRQFTSYSFYGTLMLGYGSVLKALFLWVSLEKSGSAVEVT